jgi:hypothetical protein
VGSDVIGLAVVLLALAAMMTAAIVIGPGK